MAEQKEYVLACIDGSRHSEAVANYACWIAKSIDAPIKFLHTIEHNASPAVSDLSGAIGLGASEELLNELTEVEQNRSRLLIEQGNQMLKAAKQKAIEHGIEHVEIRQRHGLLAESLIELESEILVLVMGIRGESHESDQTGLGAQLETVIRSLHKPILVVNKQFGEPKSIMLAYDGSDTSKKALEMVAESPMMKSIHCHLVHVGDDDNAQNILRGAGEQLSANGIAYQSEILHGKIDEVLVHYQAEHAIDITVMGAFSHTRLRDFLLGSFTAKMLHKTKHPLLLLR